MSELTVDTVKTVLGKVTKMAVRLESQIVNGSALVAELGKCALALEEANPDLRTIRAFCYRAFDICDEVAEKEVRGKIRSQLESWKTGKFAEPFASTGIAILAGQYLKTDALSDKKAKERVDLGWSLLKSLSHPWGTCPDCEKNGTSPARKLLPFQDKKGRWHTDHTLFGACYHAAQDATPLTHKEVLALINLPLTPEQVEAERQKEVNRKAAARALNEERRLANIKKNNEAKAARHAKSVTAADGAAKKQKQAKKEQKLGEGKTMAPASTPAPKGKKK